MSWGLCVNVKHHWLRTLTRNLVWKAAYSAYPCGKKELFSEIEISKLIYESDFDTDIKKQINNLKNYLKKTDNKNDLHSELLTYTLYSSYIKNL